MSLPERLMLIGPIAKLPSQDVRRQPAAINTATPATIRTDFTTVSTHNLDSRTR
jgi:hypothetical protein